MPFMHAFAVFHCVFEIFTLVSTVDKKYTVILEEKFAAKVAAKIKGPLSHLSSSELKQHRATPKYFGLASVWSNYEVSVNLESILPKKFLRKRINCPFSAVKLGHFIVNTPCCLCYKHSSLAAKIGKRKKTKFGRIDSRSTSSLKRSVTLTLNISRCLATLTKLNSLLIWKRIFYIHFI